ncbi:hypothetical protein SAMN06297251_102121 [Fulvimarina manganoxydans]|uniref:Uncharacterized protein n=1 Tax=Fulvimarina manganoxydans TaxID=937218 RepID=A0A1W1Z363_9HYPH|nr:hypothetical protein [Fulvimarina manganoxydans]SMC42823.1 hypothetical protein SAMN06297251_102121 [Fulvimarina manganoxydans]
MDVYGLADAGPFLFLPNITRSVMALTAKQSRFVEQDHEASEPFVRQDDHPGNAQARAVMPDPNPAASEILPYDERTERFE